MKIEVYMSNDMKRFAGKIDDKEFDYTVEEFINLTGAFQELIAKVQGVELTDDEKIINTLEKENDIG